MTLSLARRWLRPRSRDAHKGSAGRVLVIAGSRGMTGAGILCAAAAARSGAGLVKLAIPRSQQTVAMKRGPLEITTLGLPEDSAGRLSAAAIPLIWKTVRDWNPRVIALGPGLGVTAAVRRLVHELIYHGETPVVLDADGLNALAQLQMGPRPRAPLVITPHAGELARLLDSTPSRVNAERDAAAKAAALRYEAVCLLKGPGTIVTDGKIAFRNTTGNPAMASGGMGDALTGIVAAFWAQQGPAAQQAALGAFVHGLAGDIAARSFPERSLLASDLIDHLPHAFKRIWRKS